MLQVVFSGRWIEENHWFQKFNARQKKNCVYFYNYDEYWDYIINHMEYKILERFRLNIYYTYKDYITFKKFWESDIDWNVFTWYDLSSDIINITTDEFAKLIPDSDYRKKFFIWDNIKEKYVLRDSFIYYIQTWWLLM